MRLTLAMLLVLVFASMVCAQQAARVTVTESQPTVSGGSISEYTSARPDIILTPQGEGARKGRLWIRNTGKGLLIAGDIEGGPPDFPRNKDSLLAKDHIEIWLTAGVDPVLPPIGWGHQFGENTLEEGPDSCADDLELPANSSPEAQQLAASGPRHSRSTAATSSAFFCASGSSRLTTRWNISLLPPTKKSPRALRARRKSPKRSSPVVSRNFGVRRLQRATHFRS